MKILLSVLLLSFLFLPLSAKKLAQDGDIVLVDYTGRLSDGRVFDSSVGRSPLEFTLGGGQMLAAFENGVKGMAVKESKTISIPADQGYGKFDQRKIVKLPKTQVPEGTKLGDTLTLRSIRGSVPARLIEMGDEFAYVDGNPLLVDKDLIFDLTLVSIKKPSKN